MINAIIIDDEKEARDILSIKLAKHFSDINVLGFGTSVKEGVELIQSTKPQLVFLDIEMSDGTGFDLLRQLGSVDFYVIFTTAHDKFALEAFRFSAIDYLLKPVDVEELKFAINKVEALSHKDQLNEKVNVLLSNYQSNHSNKKIVLSTSEALEIVPIQDIVKCESQVNYTTFFLTNQKKITVTKTLKDYDNLLSQYGFMRTHKSHLVNKQYIQRFSKEDGGYLVMTDNSRVPVSKRKKDHLLEELARM